MLSLLQHWDDSIFILINQKWSAEWLDPLMIALSSKWFGVPFYALMVYLFFKKFGKRFWVPAVFMLVAFGLSDSISTRVLKNGVKRERPFLNQSLHARLPNGPAGSKYGFVSSHAANMFALATLLVLVMGWRRRLAWLAFGVAALVAYSRVYLGVHYPFDVLGGALLGIGISWLLYRAYLKLPLHLRQG